MKEREFSQRVRTCADKLWRISWCYLHCDADCDDALQETLLRAWQKIGTLRESEYFETWLTRILINECKRILKKRSAKFQKLSEFTATMESVENRELHDEIAALSVEMRIPLVLHYMEGYPIKTVAQMLKLPESTVKWRLHRARKMLRDEMEKEAERYE